MRYALCCLTHGDTEPLAGTLASFRQFVQPQPVDGFLLVDGTGDPEVEWPWRMGFTDEQVGFCAATRTLWHVITEAEEALYDYVFWLEHDFRFLRSVDLDDLAAVLDGFPQVAQIALCRDSANDIEREAGGLVASRSGEFQAQGSSWLLHRSYFTTTPSLMRRRFMRNNPWPSYPSNCEGRFGLDLLARAYSFGLWGQGEVWVEHVGRRSGYGY